MTEYHSKPVTSTQQGLHPKLDKTLQRHIDSAYQKPIQDHNQKAFDALVERLNKRDYDRIYMDSCCGTGMSTHALAESSPGTLVIGIDQSLKRLEKNTWHHKLGGTHFMQANCEDIWRMCARQSIAFDEHSILYPNPWPKTEHLKRRWHGHPVFPYLPKIAQKTILRSNWALYLEEFHHAWQILGQPHGNLGALKIDEPLTLFEKKYVASGQNIFELTLASSYKFGPVD
jgi:tRNA (guanine-N7-)-methyltransferase